MMSASIEIKGVQDGLVASLPMDRSWDDVLALLNQHLDRQPDFFKGARLAVDVGTRMLKVNDLITLRNALSEHGIILWAVISESATTVKSAQLLGLATRLSKPRAPFSGASETAQKALWLERTLRSGMKIEHFGPVIVIGDVNPGAEIVTASSLVVWGRLRGRVLAGHPDNQQAFICALRFQTSQALLAGVSLLSPLTTEYPVKVSLQDGSPHWEKWE